MCRGDLVSRTDIENPSDKRHQTYAGKAVEDIDEYYGGIKKSTTKFARKKTKAIINFRCSTAFKENINFWKGQKCNKKE